jgi:hypothetical protein
MHQEMRRRWWSRNEFFATAMIDGCRLRKPVVRSLTVEPENRISFPQGHIDLYLKLLILHNVDRVVFELTPVAILVPSGNELQCVYLVY